MNFTVFGFGHMGSAIVAGGLRSGVLRADDVTVVDNDEKGLIRANKMGIDCTTRDTDIILEKKPDVIMTAVRPADLEGLAGELDGKIGRNTLILSICAGKRLITLGDLFGIDKKIIRIMPNTPALVGEGMSALCGNKNVSLDDLDWALTLFGSFGKAELVEEDLFDCVTAVSGSGPAYAYDFIIALKIYAQNRGMSEEVAKEFAAQTVLGAAKMVLESDEEPETLLDNICVPKGTTIEAMKVLKDSGFEKIIYNAAVACEKRSRELGRT